MALYSNSYATIRQTLSRMLDDCILATVSAGNATTATLATTNPPQFYDKPDDYFNKGEYEVYAYAGTNMGVSRLADDWDNTTHVLTVTPAAASSYDTSSLLELHRIFSVIELKDAINQGIELFARKYLVDIDDETTVVLVETTSNDDETLYTYEYSLPTNILHLHRVTTESSESGFKLTGTPSGTFTRGETVTGSSSATGTLSYSGATYILVRDVVGAFVVGETVTGGTSARTCVLTAVDAETVGKGKFPMSGVVSPRDYTILKDYAPQIKFHEDHYNVIADLRIRLEGQGAQDVISADTDNIAIPPQELVEVAATYLPFSKIESNNLAAVFDKCLATRQRAEMRPSVHPYPNSRRVW